MAGTYENGEANIDFQKNNLQGQFLNNDRPNFTGNVSADCNGFMYFPDDRLFSFEYDKETYQIFWDNPNAGNVWNKGISFYY